MSCNCKNRPEIGRGAAFCNCGEECRATVCEGCFKLHETQWLADYPDHVPTDIFEVRFKNTRRSFYQNVNNLPLETGDIVAVEASPGHDIGIVSLTGDMVAKQMKRTGFNPYNGEFKKIYRKAKPYDIERWQEAIALEHETMIRSRQIAADMGLNMKIGDVEYQGDKIKAIFYYIADERVDFRELGRRRCALFVTNDDMDASLRPLTSLFVRQALTTLVDEADHNTRDGRLAVPVRLMLDDFANLNVANFDNILSVTRSREISCTVVCQTVSQLEARYGKPAANSIIGNCDHQLVLGFQDEETARYFSLRANKPAASLLATPARRWWLFERGCPAICDDAYQLQQHPRYAKLAASERALRSETFVDAWLESVVADDDGFEEMTQEDLEIFGDSWEA